MPAKRRNSLQRTSPRQFRCTGYGNCNMVFTRSEHLARHERKHTGEKPYQCVIENCGRMFSRFDNMMQHTQTHDKEKVEGRAASVDPKTPPLSVSPLDYSPMEYTPMVHNRTLPPLCSPRHYKDLSRRSSVSSDFSSPDDFHIRRRISLDALQTPIKHLRKIPLDEKGPVDISQDEYEVLEAFSQFCTLPVVKESFKIPAFHC
ncbi:hypothetical protein G6F56_007379 [Rhizopus delemar]|nr:hypothetical protein G6F56_007379 [Rhizopus delemar]